MTDERIGAPGDGPERVGDVTLMITKGEIDRRVRDLGVPDGQEVDVSSQKDLVNLIRHEDGEYTVKVTRDFTDGRRVTDAVRFDSGYQVIEATRSGRPDPNIPEADWPVFVGDVVALAQEAEEHQ